MGPIQHQISCLLYLVSVATFTYSQNYSCQLGEIRLKGGSVNHEGRVELCQGGVWGTICDDNWDENDAAVVCRQLGFQETDAVARRHSAFQQGTGPIHLTKYFCIGDESLLMQCESYHEKCQHDDEAGVRCKPAPCTNGDIQLVDGLSVYSGSVEVCINQQWTSICDDKWSNQDAGVACKQLGYTSSGALPIVMTNFKVRPAGLQVLNCTGKERKLINCPTTASQTNLSCNTTLAVGVSCLNFTTETVTGNNDIQSTTNLKTDFSISGKVYRWIIAGVVIGLLLGIILLLFICLLALYFSRLRLPRQDQSQRTTSQDDNTIKLNSNDSYSCPPLAAEDLLEERENPCYEKSLSVYLAEENPCYGYRNPHEIDNLQKLQSSG